MRKTISDEIIEIAKKHKNLNERIEIYGKMMAYYIEGKIVDERMRKYLDKKERISEKMKGNNNRCGTSEKTDKAHLKNSCGRTENNRCGTSEKTDKAHLKNSCGRTEKNRCDTSEKPHTKPTKTEISDEALAIYISNNNRLYNIVYRYIDNNKEYSSIVYQINKQGKEKYIYSQMKEAEKLIKEIGFKDFEALLQYISKDDFRSKQILSIAKLNRKNKEGVPYYVVIMDKMKPQKLLQERQQRAIELHRQRIAEQIQSFKSEIKEDEQTGDQKGNYNRRQNISFS